MQSTQLYLDTARLGRMSRQAQQAHFDFARLAGEEGASPVFDRFLREGSDTWPESFRSKYPGLTSWRGVGALKQSLRTLAGSDPQLPLLMFNRSAQLMKFCGRLLYQRCRNVLVTDLGWPPYRTILENEARRADRLVTSIDVRAVVGDGQTSEADLVKIVVDRFLRTDCDGLFLTAVSHLGVRLPIELIVRSLERRRALRFVVVDGAQDFCHASADLSNEYCDLYLAGAHKWLGGYIPMGLGFYGRRRSRARIETLRSHLLSTGELDDPLLRITSQLESESLDGETETVNLIPLFTCQGAAIDALRDAAKLPAFLSQRQANLAKAASLADACGWHSIVPAKPFRTGILLMQSERESVRALPSSELRQAFSEQGVSLTAYDQGVIRLSMPAANWEPNEIDQLRHALQLVA